MRVGVGKGDHDGVRGGRGEGTGKLLNNTSSCPFLPSSVFASCGQGEKLLYVLCAPFFRLMLLSPPP